MSVKTTFNNEIINKTCILSFVCYQFFLVPFFFCLCFDNKMEAEVPEDQVAMEPSALSFLLLHFIGQHYGSPFSVRFVSASSN